ncbi:MAG: hypothetical protein VB064_11645 [Oscillospiraceae bacterium]|nr:hypothetical protein [Oscillospiraceae bacterium]
MKKKYFILLLGCLLISSGCSNDTYSQNRLKQIEETIVDNNTQPYMSGGGVSLGLYDVEGKIEETKSFKLNKNESFKKIIALGNMIDSDRTYRILLFVDFNQYSFLVNGNEVLAYDFKAGQNEYSAIPIEINNLSEGFHDIFFVIVKDSDVKSLDIDYRNHTDMNNLLFIRFNVTVGNNSVPTIEFKPLNSTGEAILDGVFLSKETDKLKRWSVDNTTISTQLNFNIHVGNKAYNEQQNYALITLLDWKQVNFYNNQNLIFFSLNKGTQSYISASINTPDKKGVYDLVSILINNPYEPLTIKNSNIETGIRVGLNVE